MIFKLYQLTFRSLLLFLRDCMRFYCVCVRVALIGVNIVSSAGCYCARADSPKSNLGCRLSSTKFEAIWRVGLLPISVSWLPMMLGPLLPLSDIVYDVSSCFSSSWSTAGHREVTCYRKRLTLIASDVNAPRLIEDRAFDALAILTHWLRLLFEKVQHLPLVFCT